MAPAPPPDFNYWIYQPSKILPIIFAVLYFLSGVVHIWQTLKYKSWRFTFMLCFASLEFTGGYIVRAYAAHGRTNDLGLLIAFSVLTQVAAPVFAAASYFILGRVLFYIPYLSPIHPGRVVSTFIGLDFIIGILIGVAASRIVRWDEPQEVKIGLNLLRAAMLLQLVCFLAFASIIVVFHRRCLRMNVLSPQIRTVLFTLYGTAVLVVVRSVFRSVEYFIGKYDSPIAKNEWFFWVFEAGLLFVNSLLFNVWHPGRYLPKSAKIYLAKDGKTEIKGPGYKDPRPYWLTWVDPMDFWGLVRGHDKRTRFWDQEEGYKLMTGNDQSKPAGEEAKGAGGPVAVP